MGWTRYHDFASTLALALTIPRVKDTRDIAMGCLWIKTLISVKQGITNSIHSHGIVENSVHYGVMNYELYK